MPSRIGLQWYMARRSSQVKSGRKWWWSVCVWGVSRAGSTCSECLDWATDSIPFSFKLDRKGKEIQGDELRIRERIRELTEPFRPSWPCGWSWAWRLPSRASAPRGRWSVRWANRFAHVQWFVDWCHPFLPSLFSAPPPSRSNTCTWEEKRSVSWIPLSERKQSQK